MAGTVGAHPPRACLAVTPRSGMIPLKADDLRPHRLVVRQGQRSRFRLDRYQPRDLAPRLGDGHFPASRDATHATRKPPSLDTSWIAWAKLMARVGEEFPLECPWLGRPDQLPDIDIHLL